MHENFKDTNKVSKRYKKGFQKKEKKTRKNVTF